MENQCHHSRPNTPGPFNRWLSSRIASKLFQKLQREAVFVFISAAHVYKGMTGGKVGRDQLEVEVKASQVVRRLYQRQIQRGWEPQRCFCSDVHTLSWVIACFLCSLNWAVSPPLHTNEQTHAGLGRRTRLPVIHLRGETGRVLMSCRTHSFIHSTKLAARRIPRWAAAEEKSRRGFSGSGITVQPERSSQDRFQEPNWPGGVFKSSYVESSQMSVFWRFFIFTV